MNRRNENAATVRREIEGKRYMYVYIYIYTHRERQKSKWGERGSESGEMSEERERAWKRERER